MISSLISGMLGQDGANTGGNMAGAAGDRGAQMQQQEAQRSRATMSPWTSSGTSALGKITQLLGLGELTQRGNDQGVFWVDPANAQGLQTGALNAFQTSPGYQWRKQEGVNALDRSASAKGTLLSGRQLKAVNAFGDGLASDEYRKYMGDLQAQAGMGQGAASSANGTAAGLTGGAADLTFRGGVARGSGYTAGQNALASGIGKGTQNLFSILGYGGNGGKLGLPGWA